MAINEPIDTCRRHPQVPIYLKLDMDHKLIGPFNASIFPALTTGGIVIYQERIMLVTGQTNIMMLDHIGEGYGDSADVIFLEAPSLDLPKILFKRGDDGGNQEV